MYQFTTKVSVPLDEGSKEFQFGETIEKGDIPFGCFESMLHTGMIAEVTKEQAAKVAVKEQEPETDSDEEMGKLEIPVQELGLRKSVVSALVTSSVKTLGGIIEYGKENGDLTGINGIGKKAEEEIRTAVKKALS